MMMWRRSIELVFFVAFIVLASTNFSRAAIVAFECKIPGFSGPIFFTWYSDGSPARVGTATGVGDKALAFQDRFGAWIFVEVNMDGSPISLSTIQTNLEVIHSRHILQSNGAVLAPSQSKGHCQRVGALR
jgi:hypothetical protein